MFIFFSSFTRFLLLSTVIFIMSEETTDKHFLQLFRVLFFQFSFLFILPCYFVVWYSGNFIRVSQKKQDLASFLILNVGPLMCFLKSLAPASFKKKKVKMFTFKMKPMSFYKHVLICVTAIGNTVWILMS